MPEPHTRILGLSLGTAPSAVDPKYAAPAGQIPPPPPAPLTTGPNRYTVRVPSHATKLSLGQGDAVDQIRFNQRTGVGTESGIVGQTDVHAHLHTFGTDDADAKTFVRLGVPQTSVLGSASYSAGASTGVGTLYPAAFDNWKGFVMVTQGAALQEAHYNYVVCSDEGEVRVVGKQAISLHTPGDVAIGANTSYQPKDLVGNLSDPNATIDVGQGDLHNRITTHSLQLASGLKGLIGVVTTAHAVWKNVAHRTEPLPMKMGWAGPGFGSVLPIILGTVGAIASYGLLIKDIVAPSGPGGRVTSFSSSSTSIASLMSASLNAGVSASVSGGVFASLSATLAASVGSLVSTSMSALFSSMSGVVSAGVEGLKGASLKGTGGVEVSSAAGTIRATANKDVQINSVTGKAAIHGLRSVYAGAGGPGPGSGLYAQPTMVSIGKVLAGGAFDSPGVDPTLHVTVNTSGITATAVTSTLTLKSSGTELTTPLVKVGCLSSFKVQAPTSTITGGMVYLG